MYYDKLSDLGIKLTRRSGQEKTTCPQCTDSRKNKKDKSLSVNITAGDYRCHNCGWKGNVRAFEGKRIDKPYSKPSPEYLKNIEIQKKTEAWFKSRKISPTTLSHFKIFNKQEWMPQTGNQENCICFPYFEDVELVNIKFRDAKKNFRMVKDAKLTFFNINSLNDKVHAIITEGEIDAMSVYESGFTGHMSQIEAVDADSGEVVDAEDDSFGKWGVVSVPNGASSGETQKLEYLDEASDWLVGMHEFILATDDDDAGRKLRTELIRRLGVEKCRVVEYPKEKVVPIKGNQNLVRQCKDLNEVLIYLGPEKVQEVLLNAKFVPVDGVTYVEDVFPQMLDSFRRGVQLAPTMRMGNTVDSKIRWKKGDIFLVIGYANWGKTFFWLSMMLTKSIYDGWKWAVFCPENFPANDFYDDLVEMLMGKWIKNMTEDEYVAGLQFINDHFFYVYPDNEHDLTSIHERFRHLILKKGVDGVMVDPYNQLDHNQKSFQREDQYISQNLKDIKRFALLNNVVYTIITHPKNPDKRNEDKSLPVADMYDIAGGAMWGNKVDQIISYHRPQFHIDKNSPLVDVYIQKLKRKRTGGELGSFSLTLDWERKRFIAPEGHMPLDPSRAKLELGFENSNYRWTGRVGSEDDYVPKQTLIPLPKENEFPANDIKPF